MCTRTLWSLSPGQCASGTELVHPCAPVNLSCLDSQHHKHGTRCPCQAPVGSLVAHETTGVRHTYLQCRPNLQKRGSGCGVRGYGTTVWRQGAMVPTHLNVVLLEVRIGHKLIGRTLPNMNLRLEAVSTRLLARPFAICSGKHDEEAEDGYEQPRQPFSEDWARQATSPMHRRAPHGASDGQYIVMCLHRLQETTYDPCLDDCRSTVENNSAELGPGRRGVQTASERASGKQRQQEYNLCKWSPASDAH